MTTNGTAMVVAGHESAIARHEPMAFTADQERMIRDAFANGASPSEFAVLMEIARARRLNPLLKQVHFVKRWDNQKRRDVWSTQVSIDGLRAIAERTGKYDGQDEPEFVERDGLVISCKVRVYRKDWTRPVVGVAYWDEYVQLTKEKNPTQFWARMPHVMLAKCAEALALRKAFPEDMSGLYTVDEMGQTERVERASLESEQDLAPLLTASVEANWPAWEQKHIEAFAAASDLGELNELWSEANDEIKRLKPPKEVRDLVVMAKDSAKVALLDERDEATKAADDE